MKQLYYCLLLLMGVPMLPNSLLNAQTTVVLSASKDNTLYSEGVKSNGAGSYLFVGKTEATINGVRRALVQFDVSNIPANATITNVQLKLTGSKQSAAGIKAHRVTASWSEGTSNASGEEGGGATASINSSTWAFSNYNTVAWQNLGGDYTTTPSASANVSSGTVSIWSGAGVLQDVQDWVSGKASNFGWILIGDENTNGSAVRLNARENSSGKPSLEVTYSVGSTCRLSDSLVLVDLYRSTNGANWKNKWDLGKPMSTWYGVLMNSQGCVTYISLDDNGLVGNLSESIGNLQNLEVLTLTKNDLTGTIPNSIGNLKALEILTMDQHPRFSGSIPSAIGQCTNLMFVYLQVMNLTGTIPAEIGNLKKLKYIFLGGNKLTGSLPQQLSTLDSLVFFNAANNQITGSVPNLSRLKKIKHIGLDFNKLTTLTPNIFPLDSLRKKGSGDFFFTTKSGYSFSWYWVQGPFLSNNALTFEDLLPHYNNFFATPYNYLYAPQDSIYKDTLIQKNSGQALTVDLGIDANVTDNRYTWFKNNQTYATLTGNNKLTFSAVKTTDAGTYRVVVTNPQAPALTLYGRDVKIEVSAGVTSCRTADSLELVKLYNATGGPNWTNKWDLGKPMNTWYGVGLNTQGCVKLISLANNNLRGVLPDLMFSNLGYFSLYKNKLSGNIPSIKCPLLYSFNLSYNELSGSIPDFDFPKMQQLFLNNNQLSGPIPNFNFPLIFELHLSFNLLTGNIPNFNLPELVHLIIRKNQLSGSIPNFNIPNLGEIDLAHNQLSGPIPNFTSPIVVLHLNNNLITGEIPSFSSANLSSLILSNNRLSGKIPNFSSPKLYHIDLSSNQLMGSIPNFRLPKLRSLYLTNNVINGSIPLFEATVMEELFLNNNQLDGSIPLFVLPKLRKMGLSNNNLSGKIPNLYLPELYNLNISNNQLSGNVPNWYLPKISTLDVSSNKLSGYFSATNLSTLTSLHLQNNQIDSLSNLSTLKLRADTTYNFSESETLTVLLGLRTQMNKLTFAPIIRNINIVNTATFIYAPQDSIYRDTLIQKNSGQALTIDLGIDASITDNQYTWTKNGQTFRTITGNNKLEFSALQATDAGTYRVRVTNPKAPLLTLYSKAIRVVVNNCTTVPNSKLNSSATSDNICSGTNITLSASGGTTYRWSTGQSTPSINLSVTQNQTVTVSITDAGGCAQTLSRNLVALALPKAEISSSSTTICAGGKLSLSASPVSGAQYQWLRNNTSVLGPGSARTYEATQAGSYTVQVNVAGCTNTSAPLVVQQSSSNTAFKLNLSPTRDTLCPGDSVQISASGGLKYTWSTGSSSNAIVVKPVQSSTYAVTIADAGNCTSILRQTISLVAAPQAKPRLSDLNCGFTLLAAGTGGRAPYRYRWSTGSTSSSVTVTKGGSYELLLVDARQCSAKASIVVDSFSFLTAAPILLDPNCGAVDGSITLQLDPKREPYQIEWSPSGEGQGDNPRTQLDAGSYQALVLDKQGCVDTIEVTLNKQEDCDKDFLIYRSFSPNRDGVNESFVIQAKRTGGCPSGALNECYPNNELIIFNRWGEAVYRKKGYPSDWDADGYPGGAYFFLFYPDRDKPKGVIRGALTVLK